MKTKQNLDAIDVILWRFDRVWQIYQNSLRKEDTRAAFSDSNFPIYQFPTNVSGLKSFTHKPPNENVPSHFYH